MGDDVDVRTLTYLYGIVDGSADVEAGRAGVGDPPGEVRVVRAAGLGAVVSGVPESHALGSRHDLRAHTEVLAAVLEATDVAPVRFGVVLPAHVHVAELLEGGADRLGEVLASVAGCIEVGLTVVQEEEPSLRVALRADRRLQRLRESARTVAEQVQLGEAVAAALAAQREAVAAAVLDRLAPLVVDAVEWSARDDRTALRCALLVERDRAGELDAALEGLAEEHGDLFTVRVVSPLPPYSFTDLHLDLDALDLGGRDTGWAS